MQRANSTYEELRKEIQHAKTVVNERKQAFLNAVELLNAQGLNMRDSAMLCGLISTF